MSGLKGKLVFVSAKESVGKDVSHYDDGEYFVVRDAPDVIHVIKPSVGYDGTHPKTFVKSKVDLGCPYSDNEFIADFIKCQRYFANAPKRGEKLQWVESVYSAALDGVRLAERALLETSGSSTASPSAPCPMLESEVRVIAREETLRILRRMVYA